MKRPLAHQIGELGETRARQLLLENGWDAKPLHPDSGFDFLIERNESGEGRADFAFIQVKASGSCGPVARDGPVSFRLQRKSFDLWRSVMMPAYLIFVCLPSREEFLMDCHAIVADRLASDRPVDSASMTIRIPSDAATSSGRMSSLETAVADFWRELRMQLKERIENGHLVAQGGALLTAMGVLSGGLLVGAAPLPFPIGAAVGVVAGLLGLHRPGPETFQEALARVVGPDLAAEIIRGAFDEFDDEAPNTGLKRPPEGAA